MSDSPRPCAGCGAAVPPSATHCPDCGSPARPARPIYTTATERTMALRASLDDPRKRAKPAKDEPSPAAKQPKVKEPKPPKEPKPAKVKEPKPPKEPKPAKEPRPSRVKEPNPPKEPKSLKPAKVREPKPPKVKQPRLSRGDRPVQPTEITGEIPVVSAASVVVRRVLLALGVLVVVALGGAAAVVTNRSDSTASPATSTSTTVPETTSTTVAATTTTAAPTTTVDPQVAAAAELAALVEQDRAEGEKYTRLWVLLFRASYEGKDVEGKVLTLADVLAEHQALRADYPVLLLKGDEWSWDRGLAADVDGTYYLTVSARSFGYPTDAIAWAEELGLTDDDYDLVLYTASGE